jgi:hypothetical protein
MQTYVINSFGYERGDEFKTIAEAKKALHELVTESLSRAKRLSEQSTKHKLSDRSYSITLGKNSNSRLYAAHCILTF